MYALTVLRTAKLCPNAIIKGIAAFDDESMRYATELAESLRNLTQVPVVNMCRSVEEDDKNGPIKPNITTAVTRDVTLEAFNDMLSSLLVVIVIDSPRDPCVPIRTLTKRGFELLPGEDDADSRHAVTYVLLSDLNLSRKYILMKGWNGFADRLQCISHVINYALERSRTLCIDWSDSIWSDGRGIDFDTYFRTLSVPVISLNRLKNLPIPVDEVYPEAWCQQIDRPVTDRLEGGTFITQNIYDCSLPNKDQDDYPYQLVVFTAQGHRIYTSGIYTRHIRLLQPYRDIVIEMIKKHLSDKTVVVHLRGTDRVDESHSSDYIDMTVKKLRSQFGDDNIDVCVLTDSKYMWSKFSALVPNARLRTPLDILQTDNVGLHMSKTDKRTVNVNTIIDFFLLMYARKSVHDDNSYFAKTAKFIGEWYEYVDILGYDHIPSS